jgi:hypothetical protein
MGWARGSAGTLAKVQNILSELGGANLFFLKDVAYQKADIHQMECAMLPVHSHEAAE